MQPVTVKGCLGMILRNHAERPDDISAERIILLRRQRNMQRFAYIRQRRHTRNLPCILADLRQDRCIAGAVKFADQCLQQIGHGQKALHAAVFIDNDRGMRSTALPHHFKQLVRRHGFRHEKRRMHRFLIHGIP